LPCPTLCNPLEKDVDRRMLLRLWFLVTLVLTALLLGTSFAHTLEMPAKLQYDAAQWTWLQHTLYQAFASVGGPIELLAITSSLVLIFLLRGHRQSFRLAVIGALCLLVAFFGIWIFITNSVNAETAGWTIGQPIPPNWAQWRARWEYSHVARFVLHLLAQMTFIAALLALSPPRRE
jgi:hypothetical protein